MLKDSISDGQFQPSRPQLLKLTLGLLLFFFYSISMLKRFNYQNIN